MIDVVKASAKFCSARCRNAAAYLRYRDQHKAYRDRVRSLPEFREINRGYAHRRRARRAAAQLAHITPEQVEQRMSMFPGCWMCRGEWAEIEHVKPLALGGPHILANLRPSCGPCNRRKGAHWPGTARLHTLTTKEAA